MADLLSIQTILGPSVCSTSSYLFAMHFSDSCTVTQMRHIRAIGSGMNLNNVAMIIQLFPQKSVGSYKL